MDAIDEELCSIVESRAWFYFCGHVSQRADSPWGFGDIVWAKKKWVAVQCFQSGRRGAQTISTNPQEKPARRLRSCAITTAEQFTYNRMRSSAILCEPSFGDEPWAFANMCGQEKWRQFYIRFVGAWACKNRCDWRLHEWKNITCVETFFHSPFSLSFLVHFTQF